jgi:hypothetical protein
MLEKQRGTLVAQLPLDTDRAQRTRGGLKQQLAEVYFKRRCWKAGGRWRTKEMVEFSRMRCAH